MSRLALLATATAALVAAATGTPTNATAFLDGVPSDPAALAKAISAGAASAAAPAGSRAALDGLRALKAKKDGVPPTDALLAMGGLLGSAGGPGDGVR